MAVDENAGQNEQALQYVAELGVACHSLNEMRIKELAQKSFHYSIAIKRPLADAMFQFIDTTRNDDAASACLGIIEELGFDDGCENLTKKLISYYPGSGGRLRSPLMAFQVLRIICGNYQHLTFDDDDRKKMMQIYDYHLVAMRNLSFVIQRLLFNPGIEGHQDK